MYSGSSGSPLSPRASSILVSGQYEWILEADGYERLKQIDSSSEIAVFEILPSTLYQRIAKSHKGPPPGFILRLRHEIFLADPSFLDPHGERIQTS